MTDFVDRRNCDTHQQNTTSINQAAVDIASIKSSMSVARWIVGVVIGVGALAIGGTLQEIKSAIGEIRQDVKLVLPTEARIERLEKTVDYNSIRLSELEKSTRDHHTHRDSK